METVLVLGGTGSLGSCIIEVLKKQGFHVRATARTALKAEQLRPSVDEVFVCDPTQPATLSPELLRGVAHVISALGKSLRLSERSKTSFHEVNYHGNLNILKLAQAQRSLIKFVYVAAFNGEKHPEIAYFKAHEDFAAALRKSGIPATIIKPPALFSSFLDLMPLVRKGKLATIGPGHGRTNPIHELEVAQACVQALTQPDTVVELGGPISYTRLELLQLVGKQLGHTGRIRKVPFWAASSLLPMVKFINRSLYEKASFFIKVSKTDCVAPAKGRLRLEDYLAEHV